ncbi:HepT-like ribonuclease domain-containing protein [Leptolyngbya iicbica]|uniref:DUF86 domain-containing protein n=2 Tax=Cyanophyceae TaxID=3028117 RepID=A0A4Q7EFU0_9CYAN|nr:HepT-like ribonuclease domain-containing protein [Leptolyngbya sp. LK]RZM82155.1 DUF86 domain-containing protein [Leptolyngbya sp. LK]
MEIEVRKYLYDIQQAGQLITDFTQGQTYASYRANPMMKSAVERQFITIGEALNKAVKRDVSLNEQISDIRKIVDFRNILTHGYTNIADVVVWDILQTSLPRLLQEVEPLLHQ